VIELIEKLLGCSFLFFPIVKSKNCKIEVNAASHVIVSSGCAGGVQF
jgi:hypothetical protein